jgi:hypothetical protein
MAARILLAPTTSAAQSEAFKVTRNMLPVTLHANLLAGAETADVQISVDNGSNWVDIRETVVGVGAAIELTVNHNVYRISSPGYYRVDKDATVGSCGIYLFDDDFFV